MEIKHDKLWHAVHHLIIGKKDVRGRVSVACQSLARIHENELPRDLFDRLTALLKEAGKKGPIRNPATGEVIVDEFTNSSKRSTNKKYAEYAKEILEIYKDYQPK